MGQFRGRLALFASAAVMLIAGSAQAAITRTSGPTNLINEPSVFVKFDAAFDSVNRVYLAVWGTQFAGPTKGLFLNEAGTPISGVFAISDHSDGALQAGWARVIYSAQEGKFLVSYVKIFPGSVHAKAARFVAYTGGGPALSGEIRIATWAGHPGTEAGIGYSVPARKFFVTWWVYYGPTGKPVTFVTTIDPSGAIQSPAIPGVNGWGTAVSNPNDGQSDPEIACDPTTRHCLVIGWSWGTFYGGNSPPPAVWGRYIDDATGAPLGPDSFYLPAFGYVDSPTVSYGAGRYLVAYTGNGQVIGNTASGSAVDVTTVSGYYGLRVSSAATAAQDGGGYRYPSLSFNSATNTTLLGVAGYQGYPAAQEIDANGQPIAGALDFIPDPGPNFDARTQYTIPVANPITPGFLYLDNHYFLTLRASTYSGVGGPPPPPPPDRVAAATAAKADFSNDRRADIVWQNDDGHLSIWTMNGTTAMSTPAITPGLVDPAWRIVATGDLNGDGQADIVWQHVDGWLAVWYMNGSTRASVELLTPAQVPASWRIVGAGDLNGDGNTDLVWQHTDGWLAVWYMNGSTQGWSQLLNPGQVAGYDWKIAGVGDFNGDGKPDLVWQHTNGWLSVWYMNGPNLVSSAFLNPSQSADPDWRIRAVIDLNGDGKTDLVWQRMSTGTLSVWLMNGINAASMVYLNPSSVSGGWKIMGPR